MSVFLIILGLLLVLDLVWWKISHRWLRGKPHWRVFNALFLVVQILGFGFLIGGRIAGVRWNLPTPWMISIYLWHLLILPMLLILGILALPVLLFISWKRRRSPSAELHSTETPVHQTRRQFLLTAAVVAPPLVNIALTGYSQGQLEQFRVREMTLHLPSLPPALDGITICHITDLHVGPFTSDRVIRRVAEKVNTLRADLVLFTGDLINSKLSELAVGIDFLRSLDGQVVSIEGNHDLFEGRAPFENAVRAAGLRLLVNQAEVIPVRGVPVQLLGLRWGGPANESHNVRASSDNLIRESMRELLTLRDPAAFPILLAHHPHAFDPAIAANLPLILAGHTHGGQLMLNPQIGAGPLMFRYWSGLYQRSSSQLVVGNGVGNWFPLRTAAPAEIIHLTLRKKV